MPRISFAFFTAATVFVLSGMMLGMWMGAAQNFTFAPVHAHINLIGWASMSIMGGFFAFAKDRAPKRLPWVIFVMMCVAVIVMAPSLAMVISGHKAFTVPLVLSEFTVFAATILFLTSVVLTWRHGSQASAPALGGLAPAE